LSDDENEAVYQIENEIASSGVEVFDSSVQLFHELVVVELVCSRDDLRVSNKMSCHVLCAMLYFA